MEALELTVMAWAYKTMLENMSGGSFAKHCLQN